MEKNIRLGYLLDQYGAFLTDRQRAIVSMHVEEDLSLSEIAEILSREEISGKLSRQAVYDALKRAEQQMEDMETKLSLVVKHQAAGQALQALEQEIQCAPLCPEQRAVMLGLVTQLGQVWEDDHGI